MSSPVAAAPPARTWVRFSPHASPPEAATSDAHVTRYRVDAVRQVVGAPLTGVAPGDTLWRIESTHGLPAGPEPSALAGSSPSLDLVGVTQHLGYMHSDERASLASAPESGPIAVLIPISKSPAWWTLAQDERDAIFRGHGKTAGHPAVGRPYVPIIHRKLFHGRYLPGSGWDFLTYFEFANVATADFTALVAKLRDREANPEWCYVDREAEIWLAKVG